jgi:uncharacterized RDD family membrane protein YckC
MEPTTDQPDLLLFEEILIPASTGKRFLNYIIDLLLFWVLIIIVGIGIALVSPSVIESIDDSPGFNLMDRILTLLLYGTYMGIVEGLFKGKSLGKLITKTRAVHLDGRKIGWDKAFARSFSRAVPFCVFSAFGTPCNPWQDRWTSTMVIDEKQSINAQ